MRNSFQILPIVVTLQWLKVCHNVQYKLFSLCL